MPLRVRSLQARLLPHGSLDVLRQVLLFVVAYYALPLVAGVRRRPRRDRRFQHARASIDIEQTLGVFVEPASRLGLSGP